MEMTYLEYGLEICLRVALFFYTIKSAYHVWHDDDHRQMHSTVNAIMCIAMLWFLKYGGL